MFQHSVLSDLDPGFIAANGARKPPQITLFFFHRRHSSSWRFVLNQQYKGLNSEFPCLEIEKWGVKGFAP